MRAIEQRARAAQGIESEDFFSHSKPTAPPSLWPSIIDGSIKIERKKSMATSASAIANLLKAGGVVTQQPIPLYRTSTYFGTPRKLDNSDWLKGKEPLYGSMDNLSSIRSLLTELVADMKKDFQDGSQVGSMEMQDLEKVTAQQWKPTGWFLASPITDAKVPRTLSSECFSALQTVANAYAKALKPTGLLSKSLKELTLMDSDPSDTMTGAPTWTGGPGITHAARLDALKAYPSPIGVTPQEWVSRVRLLDAQLGLPPACSYSPVLSSRHGPLKKPVSLWIRDSYGYRAQYEATGLYDRTRFVYPAPYPVNFLLSPIYVLCSSARQRILGLWHDPESQDKYIAALRSLPGKPYAIDFSGMDTAMWPSVIQACLRVLIKAGFPSFPLEAFSQLYKTMGIYYPSYYGDVSMCTVLSGEARPWASGFKMTSEMDTLYGAAVTLSCLERQIPGITRKWEAGEWVFGELGDDIIAKLPPGVDPDRFSADALQLWGAKVKIFEDSLFLKWMLPLSPEIQKKAKTFSRFLQQTFLNEDAYSGSKGGEKPAALLRLALIARMDGLTDHPRFSRWWPRVLPLLEKLEYVKSADSAFQASLRSGRLPSLTSQDVSDILAYGGKNPSFFDNLEEQSKYQPSAVMLIDTLKRYGISPGSVLSGPEVREAYWNAFAAKPTAADIQRVRTYIPKPR